MGKTEMSEDKDLLNSAINNINLALLDVYTIESIASINLELMIEKAAKEAKRLIEEEEI